MGSIEDGSGVLSVTATHGFAKSWLGSSSYTGVTTLGRHRGRLVTVDTLANGGVASGIGASTNAASNLVFGDNAQLSFTPAASATATSSSAPVPPAPTVSSR